MYSLLLLLFAHLPIVDGVYIGSQGPYRFAFDTGAESTSIDVKLAEKLKLTPQYRVEVVTAAASSLAPALRANLRTSAHYLPNTEAILLPLIGTDGILGQSALRRIDYQIDNRAARINFGATAGAGAVALSLVYIENRIAVSVLVKKQEFVFILDSGSNAILLPAEAEGFHPESSATIETLNGSANVPFGRLDKLKIDRFTFKGLPAAIVPLSNGLLPTSLFRKITVSNSTGMLYLE